MSRRPLSRYGVFLSACVLFLIFYHRFPPQTLSKSSGRVFYVSPQGKNSNPGTREKPFATPGYGSRKLHTGDTLVILPGRYILSHYDDDIIKPQISGNREDWIIIRGEKDKNGKRPVLIGKDNLLAAIELGGRKFIQIEALEITSEIDVPYSGGLREGIDAGGSGGGAVSDILIRDVEIHHVEEGAINFSGDMENVTLENFSIHHTGGTGIGAPSSEGAGGWKNVLIRDCHVRYAGYFYQGNEQPSPWDRPDGIGMEESDGPVEISYCAFEHNRGDGVDLKSKKSVVHHTIIANNAADSLKFWGDGSRAENVLIYGDGDGNPENGPWASIVIETEKPGKFEFVNVTVDENETRGNYPVYMQIDGKVPITVLMRNCIIAHGYSEIFMGDSVTLMAEYNLFYRAGNPDEAVIHVNGKDYFPENIPLLGKGNISKEPFFVKRAWGNAGDYHLQSNSPAKDSGTIENAPKTDLQNRERPAGVNADMGAYEQE